MSATSRSLVVREHGTVARVLMAGALVGIFDMLYPIAIYAVILRTAPAIRVPQSVASGILGPAAYQGGLATVALGLMLHFTIAYGWTLLYLAVSRRWQPLRRLVTTKQGRVKAGLVLGVVVWLAMDFVVLPLSRANPVAPSSWAFMAQLLWHPVGVGLPIGLLVRGSVARG